MITRRNFLKTVGMVSAATLTTGPAFARKGKSGKIKKPGIQLWTLRDSIPGKLPETLKALGEIGFRSIEPYGFDGKFYGQSPRDFRKMCVDNGLRIISTHSGISPSTAAEWAASAAEAGLKYIVLPYPGGYPLKTADDIKKIADDLNRIGKTVAKEGLMFGYHNHAVEFETVGDLVPYDILLEHTDPSLVTFQLDLFWIIKGGYNPLDYFTRYPGRFGMFHIKDMAPTGESCIVGNGKINFRELMQKAELAGLKELIIEQEEYSEGTPIFCAERSFRYITKNLLT